MLAKTRRTIALLLPVLAACSFSACAVTDAGKTPGLADSIVTDRRNTAIQAVPRPNHRWKNRGNLGWLDRHEQILATIRRNPVGLVFLGDSITHGFDRAGSTVWRRDFSHWDPVNMGFGGDKTEHVLWRIENGSLDGIAPKAVVMMIGTNNWRSNTPAEIAQGVLTICDEIHARLPETEVLLLAIFPRGAKSRPDPVAFQLVVDTNAILAATDFPEWLTWLDTGAVFLDAEGQVNPETMPDLLHPSEAGYELWSQAMLPELTRLMNL